MAVNSSMQFSAWLTDARRAYEAHDMHRAESLYRMVLAVDPNHVDALRMVGTLLAQRGNLEEGLTYVDKAIALSPGLGRLYFFRGNILEHLKRYAEALLTYENTIAREPLFPPVYISQGMTFAALGRYEEALASFTRAVELAPGEPEAYFNRGNIFQSLRRFEAAEQQYREVVRMVPGFAPAYNNLGVALKNLGRLQEALESYKRAVQIDPRFYHAYNNIGVVQHAMGYAREALASYEAALAQNLNYAEVYNNRGITLCQLHRFEEALASYDKALELHPLYAEACNNKAYTLQQMKRYEEALLWYDKATAILPAYADALWNKSLVLMLLGDYARGLPLFEWRWKKSGMAPRAPFPVPLWLGKEPLLGKTIVLHAEQGLGDTVQFCRYVREAEALGATIVLVVPPSLSSLLGTLQSKVTIITEGDTVPAHDYHCPLMSLPLAFGTRVETIPAPIPYLFADAAKRAALRREWEPTAKLRVGVVWSGSVQHVNNHNRSIMLSQFAELFALKDQVDFHALQKDISAEEASLLREHAVATHVTDLRDFSDTAALVAEMDLVISVDTAAAHVAGALGKPVWILIPFVPDFRWMTDRADSPWYPTARLFRQRQDANWAQVLAELREALKQFIPGALHG